MNAIVIASRYKLNPQTHKNELNGFTFVKPDGLVYFVTLENLKATLQSWANEGIIIDNATYDETHNTLIGNIVPILEYPKVNDKGVLIDGRYGLTVLCEGFDTKAQKYIGRHVSRLAY